MPTDTHAPSILKPADTPRRSFLGWVLGTWSVGVVGAIVYPIARFLAPPQVPESSSLTVNAGRATELKNNSYIIVPLGAEPALLLRTAEGELRAFSAECTHLSCTVEYRDDLKQIYCNCHNGRYDLTGKNIAGPPPRPLRPFDVSVKDGDIFVTRNA